jgi:hypothetical protein
VVPLRPDHPLFDLQTLHAVVSRRALLRIDGVDEAAAAAIGEALAPLLPSTDALTLLVDANDRPVALLAALADLDLGRALAFSAALADQGLPWQLTPRELPGVERAREHGRIIEERLEANGLTAVRASVPDRDLVLRPDAAALPARAPAVRALVGELREALRDAGGDLPDDAARVTVSRGAGQVGLRLSPVGLTVARAWEAVTAVIAARAAHEHLRLAPSARWDDRLGPELELPLLLASAAGLPLPGPPGDLLLPGALAAEVELHLPAGAEPPADAWPAEGLEPWALHDPRPFTAWRVAALTTAPHGALRALPAVPAGLEDRAEDLSVLPYRSGRRWVVRAHDDLLDRDLVEVAAPRAPEPRDQALADHLAEVLPDGVVAEATGDRWLTPMHDTTGRLGLALHLDGAACVNGWADLLAALDRLADASPTEPMITAGWGKATLTVHVWYPTPGDPQRPRVWEPAR